jgi:chemotaxis protein MotB
MRKKPQEKHPNHERWIISYADFTTLLLATFVVMYAVSSINTSKFEEMAEAFTTAFMGRMTKVTGPGAAAAHKGPFTQLPSPVHMPIVTREVQVKHLPPALRQAVEKRAERLTRAYHKLLQLLGAMIEKGQVRVSLQALGVVIDINSVILFDSGQADLTAPAATLVDKVAGVIKELDYPIQVNGFTDTKPIHNAQFSSNWDLSAARAIAVVKRLAAAGIDPALLVGAGYGEFHPIAPNDTPVDMAKNRRVSIVAVSPLESKQLPETPLLGAPEARDTAAAPAAAAAAAIPAGPPAPEPAPAVALR